MMDSTLQLPGRVHVEPDAERVFESLADAMMQSATQAIDARGVFHLALSGGSADKFYRYLVTDPQWRDFPWDKTHLWLVDERRVAADDERSNIGMMRTVLTDHVPLKQRQIHPMPVLEEDPASLYEKTLAEHFNERPPRLDFILLGMGGDCHTASLFPNSDAIHVRDRWIAVNEGEAVTPPARVTMTYPLINAGRTVAVLATGGKKYEPLKRIEAQLDSTGPDPVNLPITGVQPQDGPLHWYLDAAATGLGND